jgi:hypothetical protein
MIWGMENEPFSVGQRRKDQVDMVRHYYGSVQNAFLVVDMRAGSQSQVPGEVGEMPSLMGGESYEESLVVFLEMRQVSASVIVPAEHGCKLARNSARASRPRPHGQCSVPKWKWGWAWLVVWGRATRPPFTARL